jgi:hypothetical protein
MQKVGTGDGKELSCDAAEAKRLIAAGKAEPVSEKRVEKRPDLRGVATRSS